VCVCVCIKEELFQRQARSLRLNVKRGRRIGLCGIVIHYANPPVDNSSYVNKLVKHCVTLGPVLTHKPDLSSLRSTVLLAFVPLTALFLSPISIRWPTSVVNSRPHHVDSFTQISLPRTQPPL
jgi:hypothetical protein